jgi:RNA recognition motif-containing protein
VSKVVVPRQVFLGNVAYDATEDQIKTAFQVLNIPILSVRIVIDQNTGRSRGFAFVDLAPDETRSFEELVQEIDGTLIGGRACRASEANPRRSHHKAAKDSPRGGRGERHKARCFEHTWAELADLQEDDS